MRQPSPAPASSPSATSKRTIRVSLKYYMIEPGSTLADKLKLVRDLGYDGVELDSPNDFSPDDVLKARDASGGLIINGVVDSVHWSKTLGDPDPAVRAEGVKGLERALRDAKTYGASSVLLVPAVVNEKISYADAYARSQEEIRRVLPLAAELNVKIAFENVWNNFLLSPLEAARYIDDFKSPMVAWHFDVGNIVNYGWPEQWIRTLGPRIYKLDIKEYSRKKRNDEGLWKGFDVEIGEGDCNWPEVVKALDEVGYSRGENRWAALEVGGGDEKRLKFLLDRTRALLAL